MTRREELEKLASENPQELALIFAQKVVGLTSAQILDGRVFAGWQEFPDYLNDLTAVDKAGKNAGIEWRKFGIVEGHFAAYKEAHGWSEPCFPQPNWPDCAALMIVMIECVEARK